MQPGQLAGLWLSPLDSSIGNNMLYSAPLLYETDGKRRYRLWSLLDMLRFYAKPYTEAIQRLAAIGVHLEEGIDVGDGAPEILPLALARVGNRTDRSTFESLPISSSLKAQIARYVERASKARPTSEETKALGLLSREIGSNLAHELGDMLFLTISTDRQQLYEQDEAPFGEVVTSWMPDANYDVAAAARCLALDEWTAAVFHSMRVLEHGLHTLAGRVGPDMADDVEFENWKNIIDRIEKAIRQMEDLPKGREKHDALQFYSEAASTFRYFKDAWRNHVSHSRATYDERRAFEVFNHVRSFMQLLAEDLERRGAQ